MSDIDLDELRSELEEFAKPQAKGGRSAREERIIAGFEDIQRFVDENGRAPQHGEDRDIFERLYAVRLDRLRALDECLSLLLPVDRQGLLASSELPEAEEIDDALLLAELSGAVPATLLTELRHVRSTAERQAAEEVASRDNCEDFAAFKPLFDTVQAELANGVREARKFELKAEIRPGAWFIVGGQKAYVAEMNEVFTNAQGRTDARLRVIFDNGTQSNMLMRSLQRALNGDTAGRRITDPVAGPLFSGEAADGDLESGTIYVLRSRSDHPTIGANRDLIHKIGVTGMAVEQRIAGARMQSTFLLADVDVVATYKLYGINRSRFERLIHRLFGAVQLDLEIKDRFGQPVRPDEWFLVPLSVIDEAIERIRDGSITSYSYDPASASLRMVA